MSHSKFSASAWPLCRNARPLVPALALILLLEPVFVLSAGAQGRRSRRHPSSKTQEMTEDQRIAHVLARLGFGARPGDFERVKAVGVDAYIRQQLDPDSIDDTALDARLANLRTLALATPVIIEQYTPPKPTPSPSPTPQPVTTVSSVQQAIQQKVQAASPSASPTPASAATITGQKPADAQKPTGDTAQKQANASGAKPPAAKPQQPARNPQMVVTEMQRAAFLRAVYSERQLYEMMVDFWENHFSIFANKDADRFLLTGFDREAIRPFAMGRFRDLLGATAHSPAMLYYLDNWQSSALHVYPAAGGKPARKTGGINENYARELMELHTLGVDGGYTQRDVQEVARCLTGWTIRKPNEEGLFYFNPAAHDNGEKVVLGHKIPAGGGIGDAERVLDILARHASTARFISTKLARRFIGDEPPAAVINRAADVFLKTDGSIRETLRTIITSPEFFSRAAYRSKVRSPFEYAAAAVRALNAETDGDQPILNWIARMGQPVFGHLTPEGYRDYADRWLSTGGLLERFNFANALATNRIKGTRVDASRLFANVDINDPQAVAAQLIRITLSGDVSPQTKEALGKIGPVQTPAPANLPAAASFVNSSSAGSTKTAASSNTTTPPAYVAQLITLVIGAPEFQRR